MPSLNMNSVPLAKPDEKAYERKIEETNTKLAELLKQKSEIVQLISSKSSNQDEFAKLRRSIRNSISSLTQRSNALETERTSVTARIEKLEQQERDSRQRVVSERQKQPYKTVKEIDERIVAIERTIQENALPLGEEKKLVAEVTKLKMMKPEVFRMEATSENDVNPDNREKIQKLQTRLKEIRDETEAIRIQKREETENMMTLSEDATQKSVRDLYAERNNIQEQINKLRLVLFEAEEEYRQMDHKYKVQQAKTKQAQQEKQKEERLRKQLESDRERLERRFATVELEAAIPREIIELSQLRQYLDGLRVKFLGDTENALMDNAQEDDLPAEMDGMVVMRKERNQPSTIVGKRGKKNRKSKAAQCLKHDINALNNFATYGLTPPLTTGEVVRTIDIIDEKIEQLNSTAEDKRAIQDMRRREILEKMKELKERENVLLLRQSSKEKSGSDSEDKEDNE